MDMPSPQSAEVARFPKGIWKGADYLIHHEEQLMESLRRDSDLRQISSVLLVITVVMAALYGAVMGATNLLQGSALSPMPKMAMIVVTAVKAPVLLLLTLAIVVPPVYVSNAFVGARLSSRQMVALLMASMAITATVLASMATVAFFFALTSRSYHFIKLLHVLVFFYAGSVGLGYMVRSLRVIAVRAEAPDKCAAAPRCTPRWLFFGWVILYMFVGTQLAWVLRPFVGRPTEKFQIFRQRSGNFYESVLDSMESVTERK
ncbi:hypothetical protein FJY63_01950 [Candidatus Sumerlaeota bacterium]|nr:hypothetical protein [Candidatus Sumerlaeota bacterium]